MWIGGGVEGSQLCREVSFFGGTGVHEAERSSGILPEWLGFIFIDLLGSFENNFRPFFHFFSTLPSDHAEATFRWPKDTTQVCGTSIGR
jgi:hypothetical protein